MWIWNKHSTKKKCVFIFWKKKKKIHHLRYVLFKFQTRLCTAEILKWKKMDPVWPTTGKKKRTLFFSCMLYKQPWNSPEILAFFWLEKNSLPKNITNTTKQSKNNVRMWVIRITAECVVILDLSYIHYQKGGSSEAEGERRSITRSKHLLHLKYPIKLFWSSERLFYLCVIAVFIFFATWDLVWLVFSL